MKKAALFFADGMEECEALVTVDLLKRAGIDVETVSVMGRRQIVSTHNIKIVADTVAEECDFESKDLLVLPGGMPGTRYLGESEIVCREALKFAENKVLGAICAAPSVLGKLGILNGKTATCYPGFESWLVSGGADATGSGVEVAGNVITARALGTAIPFALALIEKLLGKEASDEVARDICCE